MVSTVYNYFLRIEREGQRKPVARCKACDKKLVWHAGTLSRHLKMQHRSIYQKYLKQEEVAKRVRSSRVSSANSINGEFKAENHNENGESRSKIDATCKSEDQACKQENESKDQIAINTIHGQFDGHENESDGELLREIVPVEEALVPHSESDSTGSYPDEQPTKSAATESKFIEAVYPQYKTKTKLQLIENILDLKRQNEHLQAKAKRYEKTIHRILRD